MSQQFESTHDNQYSAQEGDIPTVLFITLRVFTNLSLHPASTGCDISIVNASQTFHLYPYFESTSH
ncbi:predicted protein [Sclerotinia sclerotiorum 1980 UF-70]|uniref:Uncharacterized protein n=1 Tax=Sclerotinia sclerotiorum (strain ATCC 18683 / 1980 / Ss-1) TaxID=665079 RepID=A7ERH6_SCLS1|nr:predicted protein [Sclerotinia sclerotiorum 1980 UF-70]EDN92068.1 predicted protein [Sclerotinia sclerotiorum 1980 UF-70]